MAFMETPRFPTTLSTDAVGGPSWRTEIAELVSGREQRNAQWQYPRQRYAVSFERRTQIEFNELNAFIRNVRGRLDGFRFKDPSDFSVVSTEGILGTLAIGTGVPAYDLHKIYVTGPRTALRRIRKPISGTVTVYRSASPVTVGGAAGNISIDYTSGVVTFVADSSAAVTAVTVGATTQVTLNSALPQLSVGEKLYLLGLGGTVGAVLNGAAHAITNIASATYTLSVNTTSLAWTSGGNGYAYPQGGEPLTWAGNFDVPVRFDVDAMEASMHRTSIGGSYTWQSISLVELRDDV